MLSELINYAPFVSLGSYILVEDTWQRHPLFAAEKFLEKYGTEFVQVLLLGQEGTLTTRRPAAAAAGDDSPLPAGPPARRVASRCFGAAVFFSFVCLLVCRWLAARQPLAPYCCPHGPLVVRTSGCLPSSLRRTGHVNTCSFRSTRYRRGQSSRGAAAHRAARLPCPCKYMRYSRPRACPPSSRAAAARAAS